MNKYRQMIHENMDELIAFRRELHTHPEPSLKEFETTDRICRELDKAGIAYKRMQPTGVCPSLHVAYSMGIVSVGLKDPALPKWVKVLLVTVVLCICAAVCFVKQHSFVDVLAALPVCLLAEYLTFHVFFPKKTES